MKKICAFFSILICLLLGVVSCKPSLPGDVLSKGKMADILYDYHVALSMAHTADGGDTGQSITYREAVLRKHDVTSAEFDSSMVYLSLIHISEPTRQYATSRMPSSA